MFDDPWLTAFEVGETVLGRAEWYGELANEGEHDGGS